MFDKKENRFLVTESMCSSVADMLLFNIYEQVKCSEQSTAILHNKPQDTASESKSVAAEKRTRKAGA